MYVGVLGDASQYIWLAGRAVHFLDDSVASALQLLSAGQLTCLQPLGKPTLTSILTVQRSQAVAATALQPLMHACAV